MLLTQTVRLKLDESEQEILKTLCRLSKNLFNVGLYAVKQYFFQERKYLSYESAYHLCKQNENYQLLATDCGQQTLKYVDRCFKAFFKLLSMRQEGSYTAIVKIPKYLPKDGFFPLVIPIRARHDFAKDNWKLLIPTSRQFRRDNGFVYITIPENIRHYRIKEIRILPKQRGRFFDIAFVYESQDEIVKTNPTAAIGIDFGLNNLATVVSTTGESLIVDGKHIKSVNQWFHKRISHLRSHKDKQGIKGLTEQEAWLSYRRSNQIRDYLSKSARYIIDFCIQRQIGTIVVGYNPTLKQGINLGTRSNQNFTQIPIFTLRAKLESLCARYMINYVEQEESYTSQSSFLDNDPLPVYNADNPTTVKFSGKRIKRGLYRTKKGHLISSDANGAANILRKSNNKLDFQRVDRVCLTQPVRVKILRESPATAVA
ncbi:transposase [Cyanosarcina cf. burmensis CCALA 770]|nr:transposase [Cyanosarcina cf. burmensis CCALA 770]